MPSADPPVAHTNIADLDVSQLDNLAWHALTGPHRTFAEVSGRAARYQSDVSIWAATDATSRDDAPAWADLLDIAGPRGLAAIFRRNIGEVPPGCETMFRSQAFQMIAPDLSEASVEPSTTGRASLAVVELVEDDAEEMLALARLTEPGPFAARTHELGRFVGVRDGDGRLIAMAGERFRSSDWVEVSAVCTHPDARSQGLAAAVTVEIARGIQRLGMGAVLHVQTSNMTAKRLYDRLGFAEHQVVDVAAVRAAP